MIPLNLPQFEFKIQETEGKLSIFDILRKKYVALTPEEWVRQHFIHLLIVNYNYPKSLIKIESGLKYHQLSKRSDIVVYDRSGNLFLVVECKAASVPVSQETFNQAARYSFSLRAKHLAVTNGLKHYCCRVDYDTSKIEYLKDLPQFDLQ